MTFIKDFVTTKLLIWAIIYNTKFEQTQEIDIMEQFPDNSPNDYILYKWYLCIFMTKPYVANF